MRFLYPLALQRCYVTSTRRPYQRGKKKYASLQSVCFPAAIKSDNSTVGCRRTGSLCRTRAANTSLCRSSDTLGKEAPDKDALARDASPCSQMIVSSVLCSRTPPPILFTKGCFSFACICIRRRQEIKMREWNTYAATQRCFGDRGGIWGEY